MSVRRRSGSNTSTATPPRTVRFPSLAKPGITTSMLVCTNSRDRGRDQRSGCSSAECPTGLRQRCETLRQTPAEFVDLVAIASRDRPQPAFARARLSRGRG